MLCVDLNCDMGEGFGNDLAIMPYISSVNIACGYHAGNLETMRQTISFALRHGLAIGAHPSFMDRENFGRSHIVCTPAEVYGLIHNQVSDLNAIAHQLGTRLHHIKPHGALYNMAAKDPGLSDAICAAIADYDSSLLLYGLAGSELLKSAGNRGLTSCSEVFADRTYQEDGTLTPRTEPNALIEDNQQAIRQVLQMVKENKVITLQGKEVPLKADTICIHGDGPHAGTFARTIYQTLGREGIIIQAPSSKGFTIG